MTISVPAPQFTIDIKCRKCGRGGTAVWEDFEGDTVLIGLSHGFYERVSKKGMPFLIELVCDGCGAIQPRLEPPANARPPARQPDPWRGREKAGREKITPEKELDRLGQQVRQR